MEQKSPNTALLVMDMQEGIVAMLPAASTILSNAAKAIAAARSNNIPVIYVVVGFRNGVPEVSETSTKSFAAGKAHFASLNMDDFMRVHAELTPADGEVTVVKRRVSAFTGSDLEVILRAFGIKHLVLAGISTSGVVLSTLREAADKDYKLTVLSDCCADRDEEVHRVLTTKVFPGQADVLMVEEWSK
ncbi:cysteine hydrolase family protein [Mucilaginibacter jinjuensis]|uniref:Cysteine hydrolase n=1 Tax=Mucilaginibacter jinjuensis TaxID=1176721 RepID=A0ABY7TE23_9SPHI|nr:isochorismatase family cysteine hydrolase [Mucilaginibacter jinjuensis]WCT14494.1 cysteine hydrolase [Mucilaginibacter jinjuensis]